MAKTKKETDDLIVDVEQVYSKTEDFIDKNKKPLTGIAIAIIALISLYYGYKKLYIEPLEEEAVGELFKAEQYFEKDSLNKAVNGDGQYLGFVDIIDSYGGTKSANLAHYYLGICYLKMGQFEDAIDELESFDSDDVMLGSIAIGAIGDAHMQLGHADDAISSYIDAAHRESNSFTTPIYLMKAAQAMEGQKEYSDALDLYKEILSNYPESQEARQVEKYIARAESFVN
jgi:tetratricopeptide (TPR) repeat protein